MPPACSTPAPPASIRWRSTEPSDSKTAGSRCEHNGRAAPASRHLAALVSHHLHRLALLHRRGSVTRRPVTGVAIAQHEGPIMTRTKVFHHSALLGLVPPWPALYHCSETRTDTVLHEAHSREILR